MPVNSHSRNRHRRMARVSQALVLGMLLCFGFITNARSASALAFTYAWAPCFQGENPESIYSVTVPSGDIGPNNLVVVAMRNQSGSASDSIGDTYKSPQLESNYSFASFSYAVTKSTLSGSLIVTATQPIIGIRAYSGYSAGSPPAVQPGDAGEFGNGFPYLDGTGSIEAYFSAPPYFAYPPAGDLIVAFGNMNSEEGFGPDPANQWFVEDGPGYNWYVLKSWPSPAAPTASSSYYFSEDNLKAPNEPATLATPDALTAGYVGTTPNESPGMAEGNALMLIVAFQP